MKTNQEFRTNPTDRKTQRIGDKDRKIMLAVALLLVLVLALASVSFCAMSNATKDKTDRIVAVANARIVATDRIQD